MSKEKRGPGYVYVIHAIGLNLHKIGHSTDVIRRLTRLEYELPCPVVLVHAFPTDNQLATEAYLHHIFAKKRVRGEWFALTEYDLTALSKITGGTEGEICYQLVAEAGYFRNGEPLK